MFTYLHNKGLNFVRALGPISESTPITEPIPKILSLIENYTIPAYNITFITRPARLIVNHGIQPINVGLHLAWVH